jgi:hypothetical protein
MTKKVYVVYWKEAEGERGFVVGVFSDDTLADVAIKTALERDANRPGGPGVYSVAAWTLDGSV